MYVDHMSAQALGITRAWPSINLPGYRDHPIDFATYSAFDYGGLPPIERELDDQLAWLLAEPEVEYSLAGGHMYAGEPVRPATGVQLDALTTRLDVRLPPAFERFIRKPKARARVRSCTACYLDLGDFPVSVTAHGCLLHFLSDQQWMNHWLLYLERDGTEAVVSTYPPYAFALGAADDEPEWASDFDPTASDRFVPGATQSMVCADSFSEFLYRFWIENEIWYQLSDPDKSPHDLTPEQQRYVDHYRQDSGHQPSQAS